MSHERDGGGRYARGGGQDVTESTDDAPPLPPAFLEACRQLMSSWFDVSGWLAHDLLKRGEATPILSRLAELPDPAGLLSTTLMDVDDFWERKLGATLLGLVRTTEPEYHEALADLFERERARDREVAPDDLVRLELQSVVEDVVFAAIRWSEAPAQREAGQALLRNVVEATISGEYWNSAMYALAALIDLQVPDRHELLARFAARVTGAPPAHPCRPSFEPERAFARAVKAGDSKHIASIRQSLSRGLAATPELDVARAEQLDRLLDDARTLDRLWLELFPDGFEGVLGPP